MGAFGAVDILINTEALELVASDLQMEASLRDPATNGEFAAGRLLDPQGRAAPYAGARAAIALITTRSREIHDGGGWLSVALRHSPGAVTDV
jgi:hypothetical protein